MEKNQNMNTHPDIVTDGVNETALPLTDDESAKIETSASSLPTVNSTVVGEETHDVIDTKEFEQSTIDEEAYADNDEDSAYDPELSLEEVAKTETEGTPYEIEADVSDSPNDDMDTKFFEQSTEDDETIFVVEDEEDQEYVTPTPDLDKDAKSQADAEHTKDVHTEKTGKKDKKSGARTVDTIFDFLELFIFTFVAVLIATSFLFRHSVVSGPSMMNTLQDGDKLIVSNLFYEPEYKDIIVVQDYSAGMTDPIVKRVIATEGQLVKITVYGVEVDGLFLEEDEYIYTDGKYYSHLARLDETKFKEYDNYEFVPGQYCQFTVPNDELFVLGDHRNISQDSYYYGCVREDSVLGKVILRFYPEFKLFID